MLMVVDGEYQQSTGYCEDVQLKAIIRAFNDRAVPAVRCGPWGLLVATKDPKCMQ